MAEKKNKTIEENMARLNEINSLMSDSSIKLEESLSYIKREWSWLKSARNSLQM